MELFRCERMQATISRRQCKINRHGAGPSHGKAPVKPQLSCEGCPGLGAAITIDVEEMTMASKCKVNGCIKLAQHKKDGMCAAHFTEKQEDSNTEKFHAHVNEALGKAVTEPHAVPGPESQLQTPGGSLCLITGKLEPNTDDLGGGMSGHKLISEALESCDDLFCSICDTFPCTCDGVEEDLQMACPFIEIGEEIGRVVTEKNKAYGNSFAVSGQFLRLLYPYGVRPEQYEDMLGLVRIFDKQKRIATDSDAFGESPWGDITGYGILGVARTKGVL